jgi:Tol biopolymer transport system component
MRDVDSAPSFTPDGTQFLFQRAQTARDIIFYMAPFGTTGELSEVYRTPPEALVIAGPLLSPDGTEVLYYQIDQNDVLHPNLMIKNLQSGNVRPVKGPRWMQISSYEWGRDGTSLYVTGSRAWAERNHVWHVDLVSGAARPITQGFDEHSHVALRSDGQALATVRTTIFSQLWHVPMDGTAAENGARARQITRGTDMVGAPQVAPDGRVAYVAEASGEMDLWVMDAEGRNPRQITFGEAQDFWQVWSPDGRRLAFASEKEGDLQVWVVDADGQNARQVTQRGSTNYGPSWSPDGKFIAYIESQGDSSFLSKIPVDGGEPVRLSREHQVMVSAQWSPDGKTIAAWAQPTTPSPQIPIVFFPADGEGEVREVPVLLRNRWTLMGMKWLPDSSALCLAQRGVNGWQLQTQPLDGSEPRVLVEFPGEEILFNFGWSPDGTFLVAQRGTMSSDILLLENLP